METMAGWLVRLDKAGHSAHNTWNNYDICGTFQIRGDSWIFQTLIDVLILRLDRDEEDGNDPHTILVSLVFQFIYKGMIDINNWKFTKLGWIWWKFDVWFIFLDLFWVIKLQNMKLLQIDDWIIYQYLLSMSSLLNVDWMLMMIQFCENVDNKIARIPVSWACPVYWLVGGWLRH